MQIHDLIGIGFGPSNLALAIALDELRQGGQHIEALFIEKQPGFAWHPDMLLDGTHMQISFLKDLVSLRNPRSRFTFVNYLHEQNRLQDFINLKTFFPSRHEFNDYLGWAASHFDDHCVYGEEVLEVLPESRGADVSVLRVRTRDEAGTERERLARNLVLGAGGVPNVPECFRALKDNPRVFHSSRYLRHMARLGHAGRVAVVGAGQSAAEIFMDLHGRPEAPQVDLVMRARSIRPSDDSPFVNEIFNAEFVDHVYSRSDSERAALLDEFWRTNYAAPDLALIERIFGVFYQQKVRREQRHRFMRRHEVRSVRAAHDGVYLTLLDMTHNRESTERYDAVVLATGYRRDVHRKLLEPLSAHLGTFDVDRDYRIRARPGFKPAIFLQGACETTHGLSDTLLSITAVRTAEIGAALLAAAQPAVRATTPGAMRPAAV